MTNDALTRYGLVGHCHDEDRCEYQIGAAADGSYYHAREADLLISNLRAELATAQTECLEQARLNGMGSEREAALMAQLEAERAKVLGLEKDAAWGAHNGGAHQLLKLQHATSVELYNALREMSPNHAVVVRHYELSPEARSGTGGAGQSIDAARDEGERA